MGVVVAIHGPTCSGKTRLAQALQRRLVQRQEQQQQEGSRANKERAACVIVHQDDFYKQNVDAISRITVNGQACHDWDSPAALLVDTLVEHIQRLSSHPFVCEERRKQRTYEGTPEMPGYFAQHAFPASERMKWGLVHARLAAQEQACHVSRNRINNVEDAGVGRGHPAPSQDAALARARVFLVPSPVRTSTELSLCRAIQESPCQ
ncbi:hypothetical protein PTSG_01467 [Salpingoeca rosetta]|uniref:Uncharacterized protein n=1 Tax=Salpingoeca rosetta (strain ATCC 50818 / BSB-021) TaxID=946362 RepID=F2U0F3_SALR5|nr:uncharacterized protein PTSG_01467 [Salpingoeca rosetta]EGD80881.1 hypothetical protein PTSG_01467 [Salpingoeca rosetta]|eukprot:XP_004997442.1 hypothetical protein PTSG_01467 [Salpingoeca rosetta]